MGIRTFSGTTDALEPIRLYVQEVANQNGLDKKAVYNLLLGIDEIATNIVLYGYEGSGIRGNVDVISEIDNGRLKVTLEDTAPPFDPTKRELPDKDDLNKPLEERKIGGLGIYLTLTGVDEFKYEYINNCNRNIFIMNIPGK